MDKAAILSFFGICAQSLLYGAYLILTIISTYSMYHTRGRNIRPNRVVMSISASLFIAITLYYGLSIATLLIQFSTHETGPSSKKSQQINTITLILVGLLFFVNFSMDCLLTYRLYTICYQNSRIVILPILMILIHFGSSVVLIALCAQAESWGQVINIHSKLGTWCAITFSISVFVCLYCTSFIICRIVQDGRAFRHFGTKNLLGPVLYIIVESAFAYCIAVLTLLASYVSNNLGAFFIFACINPPFIGINYSLVLTYVGLGLTEISPSYPTPSSFMPVFNLQASTGLGQSDLSAMIPATKRGTDADRLCEEVSVKARWEIS